MSDGTGDALVRQVVEEWYADREILIGAIVLKLIKVKADERLRCELIVSRMFDGCWEDGSAVEMLKAIHDGRG